MRHFILASAAATVLSLSAMSAGAAPMSTSDLLRPETSVSKTWVKCYRVCRAYGWCGYGHRKYRCCKYWRRYCR